MTTTISFETSGTALASVSEDMFGGNFLIDRDRMAEGTYDEAIDDLGLSNLRYPGGTVTEWFFDINDPDKTLGWDPQREDWQDLLPLSEFMAGAAAIGVGVNIVIPTSNLLAEGALGTRQPLETAYDDVFRFVHDLLSGTYGDAQVVALEIGNEYWLGGQMDVTEYARIASVIAEAAQDAIDKLRADGVVPTDWVDPDIAIQRGQYGAYSTQNGWVQNDYLIENITDEAAAAIDAVVTHYYAAGTYENLENTDYRFAYLDDWNADPRFGELEYHVTEWNIASSASDELGMRGASVLLWVFSEMVLEGVDAAFVWPVQQTTDITLTGNEGDTSLTISGEAFRLLSESVRGMDLMARHDYGNGHVYIYEDASQAVLYVTSRAEITSKVELDFASLGLQDYYYQTTHLGTAGALDDPDAQPVLTIEAGYTHAEPSVTFDIGAYGVLRIVFDKAGDFVSGSLGTEESDTLSGSSGADTIDGLGGNDFITGGAGADILRGGDGDDFIDGGDNADTIEAGAGNDEVIRGNGQDLVDLGDGNDLFWDNQQGGIYGMDTVYGGAGNDIIHGGAGDDIFFGDGGLDTIDGGGGNDDISGGDGIDTISGGAGDDRIAGDNGADKLYGDEGDDRISGGLDNDRIYSGIGNDTVEADEGDDQVFDEAGADLVFLGDGNDKFTDGLMADDGNDEVHGGNGNDRIVAFTGDDILFGDAGYDVLFGGAGNDLLDGGTERDELHGEDGHDILIGGADDDSLFGGAQDDLLNGGTERDKLFGGDGMDTLFGGEDDDWLYGNDGDDTMRGDAGRDLLIGGAGNDHMDGGDGGDTLHGEEGDDHIDGGLDRDYLYGGAGNDMLFGGEGDDRIFGGDQDDLLEGGAGRDLLDGGAGNDVLRGGADGGWLIGGAGNDIFVFGASDGRHNIYDMEEGDLIRIEGSVTEFDALGITRHGNGNVEIGFDATSIMLFAPECVIDAGDFLFV